ncbi:MAG: sulfotransferase [Alphaproteobacteria bacterium]|nr:sulfotransferase [Alphaproteobacteria bacterium]
MKLLISQKHLKTTQALSTDEAMLEALNSRLLDIVSHAAAIDQPLLFVTGAPRSGTTLLSQAIAGYFNLGFIDNLAAKFWSAPDIGIRLSRMTFGMDRVPEAMSDFGRTKGSNIHGFHFFWMNQLQLTWVDDLFSDPVDRGVDWQVLGSLLGGIQQADGRAFLMKGYYPSYYMRRFCDLSPNVLFIRINRNLLDQAASIREARLSELGRDDVWWSMQPPEIYDLVQKSPAEQISGQILGLNRYFDRQSQDPTVRCLDLDYDALCENPKALLMQIGEFVYYSTGKTLSVRGALPSIAKRRTAENKIDCDFQRAIEAAIAAFQ